MRLLGVEPKQSGWRPDIIPLDYNRLKQREKPPEVIETPSDSYRLSALPLSYGGREKRVSYSVVVPIPLLSLPPTAPTLIQKGICRCSCGWF